MLRKIVNKVHEKARGAWETATGGRHVSPEITISGLKPEEKMMKDSIYEECARHYAKMKNEYPVLGLLIHFKSNDKANRQYEVHGLLKLDEGDIHTKTTNRDAYFALKIVLDELFKQLMRARSKRGKPE